MEFSTVGGWSLLEFPQSSVLGSFFCNIFISDLGISAPSVSLQMIPNQSGLLISLRLGMFFREIWIGCVDGPSTIA